MTWCAGFEFQFIEGGLGRAALVSANGGDCRCLPGEQVRAQEGPVETTSLLDGLSPFRGFESGFR